jgi:hypothetical protein
MVLTLSVCLLAAQGAAAYSGSITNVHPSPDGFTVSATYTTTFDQCDEDGFCGWYPHAWQVPASQACAPGGEHFTYVGDYHEGPATETATDDFFPDYEPARICLYVSAPDDSEILIAEYLYRPVGAAPTPTGTPAPTAGIRPMTVKKARSLVPGALRERYGRRFSRSTLRRACHRLTSKKVRCRVSWRKGKYAYRGTITLRNDPDDPENSFIYTTSVKRKRLRK